MIAKPKRALILDFDGVVVVTEKLHFDCWNMAFDDLLGIRISGSHEQLVGLTLEQIYALWCQSVAGEQLQLSAELKQQLLDRKTDLFFAHATNTLVPSPGVVTLIRQAQAIDWYVTIASRALRQRLLRTLDVAGLPPLFDLVMAAEDVVDKATDRKIHSLAAAPFGVEPACCVVVEDSVSGVQDALACGIGKVIGLTSSLSSAELHDAGAHQVVDSLTDIMLSQD